MALGRRPHGLGGCFATPASGSGVPSADRTGCCWVEVVRHSLPRGMGFDIDDLQRRGFGGLVSLARLGRPEPQELPVASGVPALWQTSQPLIETLATAAVRAAI